MFHRKAPKLAILVAAVAVTACRCDPPQIVETVPDLIANPVALSFAACPVQDENGNPVADVFPDQQRFTLENIGKASASLTFTFSGPGADRFRIINDPPVDTLPAGSREEIIVEFSPIAQGDVTATLTIDDQSEETDPVTLSLIGQGSDLAAQPTLEVAFETDPGSGNFTECTPGLICAVGYPLTFYGQSSTLRYKVRNRGCPALKITGIELTKLSVGGSNQAFYLEQPAVLPTSENPIVLTTADGNAEMEMAIRFQPEDDEGDSDTRITVVTLMTNDPNVTGSMGEQGHFQFMIQGEAGKPACYVTPTFCNYTDDADTCGGTKVVTGTGFGSIFRVTNGGTVDVTISDVSFRAPASPRFAITGDPTDETLAPGMSADLAIEYTDDPEYVTQLLDVECTANGMPAGRATISLGGGVLPCLSTTPDTRLDFSGATEQFTTKPVEICNCPTGGDLIVNKVSVTQGGAFFSVPNPPAAGTRVAAGDCISVDVQYKKPVSGGLQAGTLQIETNDPDYAAPSHYAINLFSENPLDQIPVAVLTGPIGQTGGFTVDLQTLNPKKIRLKGGMSYDPPNNDPVMEYQYILAKVPQPLVNGQDAWLEDPADPGQNVSSQRRAGLTEVDLVVDDTVTGDYYLFLNVWDSAGQKSGNTAQLIIKVRE